MPPVRPKFFRRHLLLLSMYNVHCTPVVSSSLCVCSARPTLFCLKMDLRPILLLKCLSECQKISMNCSGFLWVSNCERLCDLSNNLFVKESGTYRWLVEPIDDNDWLKTGGKKLMTLDQSSHCKWCYWIRDSFHSVTFIVLYKVNLYTSQSV